MLFVTIDPGLYHKCYTLCRDSVDIDEKYVENVLQTLKNTIFSSIENFCRINVLKIRTRFALDLEI